MSSEYPAIPEPTRDVAALLATVMALKEAVEMMTGQRGSATADLASRLAAVEQVVDFVVASSNAALANEVRDARGGQVNLSARITQVAASVPDAFAARSVLTGAGLTGGGNLASDRSLLFDTAWGDARYALRAGDVSVTFSCAPAAAGVHAVNRDAADARYARLSSAPFTATPTVNGSAVWHAGTLEPSTYGGLGSPLWSTTGGATGAGNTVSGASLTPAQTGQWRQMSNNVGGSALFVRVS